MASRTQITFTDDARRPRTITFGGDPLVRWYAYLRDPDGNLYLQREEDGVLDSEELIVSPDPPSFGAPSTGIEWFDFHVDPSDASKAYLFFLSDGTLWEMVVTSTPVGEKPTAKLFDRINNRADLDRDVPIGGLHRRPSVSQTSLPRPVLAIATNPAPNTNTLVISLGSAPLEPDLVEVYQSPNGGSTVLFAVVNAASQILLDVPAPTAPDYTIWRARSVSLAPAAVSLYGQTLDTGAIPSTDLASSTSAGGAWRKSGVTKTNRQPIKAGTRTDTDGKNQSAGGAWRKSGVSKTNRQPIKAGTKVDPNGKNQSAGGLWRRPSVTTVVAP